MSYGRPSQSKAQNEANARVLRALVKQPENKVCADCKRNDPRWASWNIGCFLCIRCSGIHRSMGTHISKVKSIDLDIWTPEQMEAIQKWGNKRCNLYWEAHLKSGHIPPEHKIESFIRSKYESRRWAKDGPPPTDLSVLEGGSAPVAAPEAAAPAATSSRQAAPAPAAAPQRSNPIDLLSDPSPAPPVSSSGKADLLGGVGATAASSATQASKAAPAPAPAKASGGGGGIFDLDWHEPAGATSPTSPGSTSGGGVGATGVAKGKNDIMSLFAAKPAAAPAVPAGGFGDFGSFASPASPSGGVGAAASTGFGGLNSGFAGLDLNSSNGASSSPWAQPSGASTAASSTAASSTGNGLFDTQDVWGSSGASTSPQQAKAAPKNDAFADIWGDFK